MCHPVQNLLGTFDFPLSLTDFDIESDISDFNEHYIYSKSFKDGTKAALVNNGGLGCNPRYDFVFPTENPISILGLYFHGMTGRSQSVTITDSNGDTTVTTISVTSSEYFWGVQNDKMTFWKLEFSPIDNENAYTASIDEITYGVIDV